MVRPTAENLQSADTCSVCLELVDDTRERSIAKLICGHQFHLDCIGSAFNAKGSMQCPNCRKIEHGEWLLYGNGPRQIEDSMPEDLMFEEGHDVDYDEFGEAPELFFPEDSMIGHSLWHGGYQRLSFSYGNGNHHHIDHGGVLLDVLVGEDLESTEPFPFVLAQAPASSRRASARVENVGQQGSARFHHGAPYQWHFTPSSDELDPQSPAVLRPIGVGEEGIGLPEATRWPQPENQLAGDIRPSQLGRRRLPASTPAIVNITANEISPTPARWDYSGTFGVQNAARLRNNANFRQRRQWGSSRLRNSSSEAEGEPC